MNEQKI